MPIELVIFDLDGTLIDSRVDICNAVNHAVAPYGGRAVSVQETVELIGEGISRLMEKIIAKEGLHVDRDSLTDRFLEHYSAHLVDHTAPYPGVRETLEKLGAYRKAVVSNKRQNLSAEILERLGLERYFELVVGNDTTGIRKPSPAPLLYALSNLGVSAGNAVIVGDSDHDIQAGAAAGVKTVAVAYGYRPVDFLRGADFIIKDMPELPGILNKIR